MYSVNRVSSVVDKDIRSFRDRYIMSFDVRLSIIYVMRVSVNLNLYILEFDY